MIKRVPLDTPPQALVMSLAHNHQINLFISSYRGAAVIKFKQQKHLCGRRRQGTFLLVVAMSLPFDYVTLTNLYISRGHRGYVHPSKHLGHHQPVSNIL